MPLTPGTRVGPFEIVAPIGAGGMGEVYRARDTRLNRDVAIKVVPELFAKDPDRRERFEREAQVLASLNHPHIAQIHGVEESSDTIALVMELVEGETLADRVARGAIALDDAIPIARQIAEALEAAHDRLIIHRDLKPANIKVRPDGTVKVLDFGLAKALDGGVKPTAFANSPTFASPMTEMGVILGTAAYMAPEQAKGKALDKRVDIWAFGCVLFEMLTGRAAFAGESITDVLAAVTRDEPAWARVSASIPPALHALLRRCLDKDPRRRLRDIGEARVALEHPDVSVAAAGPEAAAGDRLSWSFAVTLPPGHRLPLDETSILSLSSDGRTLVFIAASQNGRQLYRRNMEDLSAVPIAGTEGAENPFLSPDGEWVGFIATGWLKKVPIHGGVPLELCEVTALHRGATWAPDGRIIFSPAMNTPLMQVDDTGGVPRPLTTIDSARGERSHRWPQVVAEHRAVVFTIGSSAVRHDYDDAEIGIASLDTGETRRLATGARTGRAFGCRLFLQRRATLLQATFDPRAAAPVRASVTLLEGVAGDASCGSGYFAVGGNVLAYAPVSAVAERLAVFLVDRQGQATRLPLPPKGYCYPRLSPDGTRLAFHIADERDLDARGQRGDVWVYDIQSNRLWRLSQGNRHTYPCWSPDGTRIAYMKVGAPSGVCVRSLDGAGGESPLWVTPGNMVRGPDSWHPDGSLVAVTLVDAEIDAWIVATSDGEAHKLIAATGTRWGAVFSPDGRSVAYTSVEGGAPDVFVQRLDGGERWQVSTDGGMGPVWSRDGGELFFRHGDLMMAAEVEHAGSLRIGPPRVLFRSRFELRQPPTRNYDVMPDGRFVMLGRADEGPPSAIHVMVNPFGVK
jgi:serine/threonine protein kinase/Tol biopolymer transport system component